MKHWVAISERGEIPIGTGGDRASRLSHTDRRSLIILSDPNSLIAVGTLIPITSSGKAVRNDGALALSQSRRTSFAGYSGELKFAAAQMKITNMYPCGFLRTSLRAGVIVIDHHPKFDICWVVRTDDIDRKSLLPSAVLVLQPGFS